MLYVTSILFQKEESRKILLVICWQVQAQQILNSWAAPRTLEIKGNLGIKNLLKTGNYSAAINSYEIVWIRANFNVDYQMKDTLSTKSSQTN